MTRRSSSLFIVLLLGLSVCHGRAALAADPTSFVDRLVHEGLRAVGDTQLSAPSREQRFAGILDSDFDFPRIARFVMGHYWSSTPEPERQRFATSFKRWVIHTYSSRFGGYSGESVQVTGSRPESDTTFIVTSQVTPTNGAPPLKVDWRVRRAQGDDYKVVDVAVEGVSMLLAQREEFASVIERSGGTVAALTRVLEERIAGGDTSGGAMLVH